MDKLFFLVSLADERQFHTNYFIEHGAFLYGLLLAAVIGVVVALVFYYGCCNSSKSMASATLTVWVGCMVAAGALTYLTANFVLIGKPQAVQGPFYDHSFYKANEEYASAKAGEKNTNENEVQEYNQERDRIADELDKGDDARVPFSAHCAIYAMLAFFLCSLAVKGTTIHGTYIPVKWPAK